MLKVLSKVGTVRVDRPLSAKGPYNTGVKKEKLGRFDRFALDRSGIRRKFKRQKGVIEDTKPLDYRLAWYLCIPGDVGVVDHPGVRGGRGFEKTGECRDIPGHPLIGITGQIVGREESRADRSVEIVPNSRKLRISNSN